MQTKNKMRYTPFFNLCERDLRKLEKSKANTNFPKIIRELITEVNNAEPSCFGNNEKHYADYNFVHDQTKYTCLHWLAYHNDSQSLMFILNLMSPEKPAPIGGTNLWKATGKI